MAFLDFGGRRSGRGALGRVTVFGRYGMASLGLASGQTLMQWVFILTLSHTLATKCWMNL